MRKLLSRLTHSHYADTIAKKPWEDGGEHRVTTTEIYRSQERRLAVIAKVVRKIKIWEVVAIFAIGLILVWMAIMTYYIVELHSTNKPIQIITSSKG